MLIALPILLLFFNFITLLQTHVHAHCMVPLVAFWVLATDPLEVLADNVLVFRDDVRLALAANVSVLASCLESEIVLNFVPWVPCLIDVHHSIVHLYHAALIVEAFIVFFNLEVFTILAALISALKAEVRLDLNLVFSATWRLFVFAGQTSKIIVVSARLFISSGCPKLPHRVSLQSFLCWVYKSAARSFQMLARCMSVSSLRRIRVLAVRSVVLRPRILVRNLKIIVFLLTQLQLGLFEELVIVLHIVDAAINHFQEVLLQRKLLFEKLFDFHDVDISLFASFKQLKVYRFNIFLAVFLFNNFALKFVDIGYFSLFQSE